MEIDRFITAIVDREGVRYPLNCHVIDSLHTFQVRCGGVVVAGAACWLVADKGELQLNDLLVADSALIPWLNIPFLGAVGLVRWRSFRRRGLAAALVVEIVRWCRQNGLKRITGKVVAADLAAFPGLAEMYRRFGFAVTPGSGKTSYLIELQL